MLKHLVKYFHQLLELLGDFLHDFGLHLLKVGGVASVPHGRCVEELRGEL